MKSSVASLPMRNLIRVIERGTSFNEYAIGDDVFLTFGHIMAFPK